MFDFQRNFYLAKIEKAFDLRTIPSRSLRRLIESDEQLKNAFLNRALLEIRLTEDFDQWFAITPQFSVSTDSFISELKRILQNEFNLKNDTVLSESVSNAIQSDTDKNTPNTKKAFLSITSTDSPKDAFVLKKTDLDKEKIWTTEIIKESKTTQNSKIWLQNNLFHLTMISLICLMMASVFLMSHVFFQFSSENSDKEINQIATSIANQHITDDPSVTKNQNLISLSTESVIVDIENESSPSVHSKLASNVLNEKLTDDISMLGITHANEKNDNFPEFSIQSPLTFPKESFSFSEESFDFFALPFFSPEIISFIMIEKNKKFFQKDFHEKIQAFSQIDSVADTKSGIRDNSPANSSEILQNNLPAPSEKNLDTNTLFSYAIDLYMSPLFFDTTN